MSDSEYSVIKSGVIKSFDCILPFCLVSTLLIHVALKKPTSPETAHEIVCTLHIFKTINESSDKSVD